MPNAKKVLAFISFPKYSLYLRDRVFMWQDVKNGVSVFFTGCKGWICICFKTMIMDHHEQQASISRGGLKSFVQSPFRHGLWKEGGTTNIEVPP